jgi:hypothetical protein
MFVVPRDVSAFPPRARNSYQNQRKRKYLNPLFYIMVYIHKYGVLINEDYKFDSFSNKQI